jgi:hypothetical protein
MKLCTNIFIVTALLASSVSIAEDGDFKKLDNCLLEYQVTDKLGRGHLGEGYLNLKKVENIQVESKKEIIITSANTRLTLRKTRNHHDAILAQYKYCSASM